MSVLLGDRKESKFEAITYSIELHDMLILLMQRGFGVKDVDGFVRKKYAYGEISEENFAKYRELMRSFKSKVNQCASLITSNVRAANTIYPRTMHEYETRRDYQNAAIVNCEQLIDEKTGEPFTAHTTNPVPFLLVNYDPAYTLRDGGCLADIVPTMIEMMGMEQPKEMTGKSLLVRR